MQNKRGLKSNILKPKHKFDFSFLSKLIISIIYIKICFQNDSISKIHLVVEGTGEISFLYSRFPYEPSDVIINGVSKGDNCSKICDLEENKNNVTLIFDQQIESCFNMFFGCENIKEIDLSEFDNSNVEIMARMFRDCINLEKINFGNINTSLVNNMQELFYNCLELKSIDLSNFDTSEVSHMGWMFFNCASLTSINLTNFNTSKVESMYSMFAFCENLISIDVSNFDTSKVSQMCHMFNGCNNLYSLDLSNFDTSKVYTFFYMFNDCNSLIYLNLDSFNSDSVNQSLQYNYDIFGETYPIFKSCLNDPNLLNVFQNDTIFNCSDRCFDKDIKLDIKNDECLKSCEEGGYNYEYNNLCYDECPEGSHIAIYNEHLCIDDIKCKEYYNKDICYENAPEGYYYDINDGFYKLCFKNCKSCDAISNEVDNNCIECKPNFHFFSDSFYKKNCYEECPFYYYFNEFNQYKCTEKRECPDQFNKLIASKKKCTNKCKNSNDENNEYIFEYNNICYKECPKGTIYNETIDICILNKTLNEEDKKLSYYQEKIADGSFNDLIQNLIEDTNGTDLVVPDENITIQITTSDMMKNNKNKNISNIDLGDCEDILRNEYNINKSFPLIIFKIDFKSPDTLIPIIGYEIYSPLDNSKLDLSICNNTSITLNIPVSKINEEELFLYDPESDYYNDMCFSYTTENGTDILITDRIDEFIKNNLSLCENNCNYEGYNTLDKQSTCNCQVKNEMEFISDIMDNPNKLSTNFNYNDNKANTLNIFKCTKNLFSVNGLAKNISSYILAFSFFYFFLSIVFFIKCGYRFLILDINKIIKFKLRFQGNNLNRLKTRGQPLKNNKNLKQIGSRKIFNFPPKKVRFQLYNNVLNSKKNINQNNLGSSSRSNLKNKKLKLFTNLRNEYQDKIIKGNINNRNGTSFNIIKNKINFKKNNFKNLSINTNIKYNDYEKNTFNYEKAVLYDKRSCCQYYIALIKIKHPLLFAFGCIDDYNSRVIKICIFILKFALFYLINFEFFDDKVIHKIYEDKGKYDVLFFFPYISISFAISHVIIIIIKLIFLSERNISKVRNQSSIFLANRVAAITKRNIKIKYYKPKILSFVREYNYE